MSGNVSTCRSPVDTDRAPAKDESMLLFLANANELVVSDVPRLTSERDHLRSCIKAGWLVRKGARYVLTSAGAKARMRGSV